MSSQPRVPVPPGDGDGPLGAYVPSVRAAQAQLYDVSLRGRVDVVTREMIRIMNGRITDCGI